MSGAFALAAHPLAADALLRPLRSPGEADTIARMLAVQEPWRRLGYGAGALARYLGRDDPGLHRFAVVSESIPVGDVPAGVVCIRWPWLRGPYLELIGFDPRAQGGGLGRAVIDWMEAEVRGAAANLWAFVSEANIGGRRFYAARGFVEVAPVPDLVAPGHAEILVRKRLDQPEDRLSGRGVP